MTEVQPDVGTPAASAAWLARTAVLVAVLLVVAYLLLPTGGPAQLTVLALAALGAPSLLAVRLYRGRLLGTRPWLLLLAGTGLYGVASPFWGVIPVLTGRTLPFPSPLDAVYFASYALSAAFLVSLLVRQHRHASKTRREAAIALLDAGIFGVAVIAALWPHFIGPNIVDPEVVGLALVVAVGYLLVSAVLVGLVVRVAIGNVWTPGLWLLLVWAGGELIADIAYSYLSIAGTFTYGHPLSLMWLLSYLALGALALHPGLPRLADSDAEATTRRSSWWLPLGAVLIPLLVSLSHPSRLLGMVAIVGVLLVVSRLGVMSGELFQQRQQLADDLAEQGRLMAELAELSEQFEHQSLHDGLTGLANRSLLHTQLEQAWAHQQRHGRGLVVLGIDLDGFKPVNDRYGHHAGDQLLVETAQRIRRCVRESDTLARVGGDEFAILMTDASRNDAREVAERIERELARPMVICDEPHTVTASIGIAEADQRQHDPDELLRAADRAMYAAKIAGGGRHATYEPGVEGYI